MVLDLATEGDLFDYVFTVNSGFSERITRYYFLQLMNALKFLHENDVVHRDLKVENLLLDSDFNLKIADFGLSTTVESKYGYGIMYTRVGTERYMPPEMLEKNAYIGTCADLFSAGVILFVLAFGVMPTHRMAKSDDYLYQHMRKKDYEKFWSIIKDLVGSKLDDFGQDFYLLVTTMLKYDYKKRYTLDEILDHPWMKGEVATPEEVKKEL